MEELRGGKGGGRQFSGVLDIAADSFKREVTDAADDNHFVVVHLYDDGREDCTLVDIWMRELCSEHPRVKFTRIFFSNAIPNYPAANLPTVSPLPCCSSSRTMGTVYALTAFSACRCWCTTIMI